MKDKNTRTRQAMILAFSINIAALEFAQESRKRRVKSQDIAIMYFKAAITELRHGKKADMAIVRAAINEALKYLAKPVRRKKPKQFPPGGIVAPGSGTLGPEEGEWVVRLKQNTT